MTDSVDKPHDHYFRNTLRPPGNAASEIRPLVAGVSKVLADNIDWGALKLRPNSHVSHRLQATESDLLFTTTYAGREALLYLLLEHQSSPDELMALRMSDYSVSILMGWVKENKKSKRRKKPIRLPLIIPMVVYANPEKGCWTAATDLADLFDIPDELREQLYPHIPHLRYLLDDLNAVDVSELLTRPYAPAVMTTLVLLKTAPKNDRLDLILEILKPFMSKLTGEELSSAAIYCQNVGTTDETVLGESFHQLGPKGDEAFMTTAEKIRTESEAVGEVRGKAEMLTEAMALTFGPLPAVTIKAIRTADAAQLHAWLAETVQACSLEQTSIPH